MKHVARIPDAELTLMKVIWSRRGENGRYQPISTNEIMERLDNGWSVSTVFTLLSRLVEKGFLAADKKGRSNVYRALVEEKAYQKAETRQFLDKLYEGSLKNMVAAMCEDTIDQKEMDELLELLEHKRNAL